MKILAVHGHLPINGCAYHRIVAPLTDMAKNYPDVQVTWASDLFDYSYSELVHYDVIIALRTLTSVVGAFDRVLYMVKELPSTKLIIDTDDHWNIPADDSANPYFRMAVSHGIPCAVKKHLQTADLVWTTTKPLAKELIKLNPDRVDQIPNGINAELTMWKLAPIKTISNHFRVGIFCQQTHNQNIARLATGLRKLMAQRPNTQVVCLGVSRGRQPEVLNLLKLTDRDNVLFRERLDVTQYAEHYQHFDVLLAPLKRNTFNTYRSPLKLWECAISRTPIIAENYGPYRTTFVTGVTLVNDWSRLPDLLAAPLPTVPPAELTPTWPQLLAMRYSSIKKLLEK